MTKRVTHCFNPSSNALPFTGSGHGSTGGRINPSNDSSFISLYYRQRQARGLPVRFTRRNADFSRLNAPALHALVAPKSDEGGSRLTAATVLTTVFSTTNSQTQATNPGNRSASWDGLP